MTALLKDLLYGGRNEYLDLIRLLGLLGGLLFLVLTVLEFAGVGQFDEGSFAVSWVALLGGTAGAIWGRTRIDRMQREDVALGLADDAGKP